MSIVFKTCSCRKYGIFILKIFLMKKISVNTMMKFVLYLFVFVFLSNTCWAEWKPMPSPGVCEKTPEAIKSLMDEKYKPIIYSEAEPEKKDSRINVVVWTNSDDEILVTVSRMNYNLTCIVGLGDKNTTWVGIKKDEKN